MQLVLFKQYIITMTVSALIGGRDVNTRKSSSELWGPFRGQQSG